MKLSEFKYNLPKNSIAKFPSDPRDSSRLMILNRETGETEDKQFKDILDLMQKGDCIVINETKVFPARLYGKKEKTNATIEVLLLR
jgi:S-adenosylmethionine:tRNA ribosyltransferase-isomerase